MKPYRSIGIMSGTSADGIDAVLLQMDDVYTPHDVTLIHRASQPFSPELSHELVHAQELSLKRLTELHFLLPQLYAQTVQMLPDWRTAHCCGVHGQTITHQVHVAQPMPKSTLQIGVSSALAIALNLPTVGDLRSVDVALNGQGAPIVPVAHWFFLAHEPAPVLVVNLGGICNITLVKQNLNEVQGYDVGPGMMLSDAYARLSTQGALAYDRDGTLSSKGRVLPELLNELHHHPFVLRAAPKSAGREDFGRGYYEPLFARYHGKHSAADIMRTLIEATATILHRTTVRDFGAQGAFAKVMLTGGGALNPQIQAAMARAFHPTPVGVATHGVMAPQNHEPAAMALIAARTMHGLPSALPSVTGSSYGSALGHIFRPTPPSLRLHKIKPEAHRDAAALAALVAGPLRHTAEHMLSDGAATAVSLAVQRGHDAPVTCAVGTPQRYAADASSQPPLQPLPDNAQRALTPNALFDVASLTKVAATTACIMALVSDGRLSVQARAATFLPMLQNTAKRNITVAELLSHRSGLSPWAPLYLLAPSPHEALEWVARSPLAPSGERIYSDLGYMLLGAIIEAITAKPLQHYFNERIAGPLQLQHCRFGPVANSENHEIVATAHNNLLERTMLADSALNGAFAHALTPQSTQKHSWRTSTLVGEVNDGNAHHVFAGAAGHAGLFASAKDLARIAAAMTEQGQGGLTQEPLFSPEVTQAFLQPLPGGGGHTLGWANPLKWQSLARYHSMLAQHGCVLAEGFTGCLLFAAPHANITLALLANRQHTSTPHVADRTALPKLYPYWSRMLGALLDVL